MYTAEQKFIRTSARKIRFVADGIAHLTPQQAVRQLKFSDKRAAAPLSAVIKRAIANAVNNDQADQASLRFAKIEINEGPTYKRWRAVSRSRAHSIFKRTSHIKITLTSIISKLAEEKIKPVAKPAIKKTAKPITNKSKK